MKHIKRSGVVGAAIAALIVGAWIVLPSWTTDNPMVAPSPRAAQQDNDWTVAEVEAVLHDRFADPEFDPYDMCYAWNFQDHNEITRAAWSEMDVPDFSRSTFRTAWNNVLNDWCD